jgi:hypothetical protein
MFEGIGVMGGLALTFGAASLLVMSIGLYKQKRDYQRVKNLMVRAIGRERENMIEAQYSQGGTA